LIVLYDRSFGCKDRKLFHEENNENLLTNLEVAFRFLATLSSSRASTFKWQVIHVNSSEKDLQNVRQSLKELLEL